MCILALVVIEPSTVTYIIYGRCHIIWILRISMIKKDSYTLSCKHSSLYYHIFFELYSQNQSFTVKKQDRTLSFTGKKQGQTRSITAEKTGQTQPFAAKKEGWTLPLSADFSQSTNSKWVRGSNSTDFRCIQISNYQVYVRFFLEIWSVSWD